MGEKAQKKSEKKEQMGRLKSMGLTLPCQIPLLLPDSWDDLTRTVDCFDTTLPATSSCDAELHRMCKRGRSAVRWVPPETFHRLGLSEPSLLIPRITKGLKPVRIPGGTVHEPQPEPGTKD